KGEFGAVNDSHRGKNSERGQNGQILISLELVVKSLLESAQQRCERSESMPAMNGYIPTADGPRLFFQKIGDGLPALVIPNGPPMLEPFSTLTRSRALIAYDARNRGNSDLVEDDAKIAKGIVHDVDDIEAVRSHFDLPTIDLLGHSYMGLTVILYAMRYPHR